MNNRKFLLIIFPLDIDLAAYSRHVNKATEYKAKA